MGQTGANKRSDSQVEPPFWTPTPTLDGAHLLANASIRDFQQGKAGYVTDAVEQALLLPKDMADLGSMRLHKVFLNLKRDLEVVSPSITFFFFFSFFKMFPPLFFLLCFFPRQAIQAIFSVEEIINFCQR